MSKIKLTKPQLTLLKEVVTRGVAHCDENYPPRRKLVDLNLITEQFNSFYGGSHIKPTDAGRATLAEAERTK